ncbi:MAG: DUF1149 family protein [Lactobacillales bacterium]|jgi:hypothetical protein|nr:DUF1149 family protein [Lactobacillales bacterium]
MNLEQQKPLVIAYHWDVRNFEEEAKMEAKPETNINVSLNPVNIEEEQYAADSFFRTRLTFLILFDAQEKENGEILPPLAISGAIEQMTRVIDRKIEKQEDLSQDDMNELVAPLFDMARRLTQDVSEIALDIPGIVLNFENPEA